MDKGTSQTSPPASFLLCFVFQCAERERERVCVEGEVAEEGKEGNDLFTRLF